MSGASRMLPPASARSTAAREGETGQAGFLFRRPGRRIPGSGYPYELVKKAGVDLAPPAPCQALAARTNSMMDEIEAILARQKK